MRDDDADHSGENQKGRRYKDEIENHVRQLLIELRLRFVGHRSEIDQDSIVLHHPIKHCDGVDADEGKSRDPEPSDVFKLIGRVDQDVSELTFTFGSAFSTY